MGDFITDATACVRLKEGRIRRLYDGRTGKVIRSLMDLKDGQNLLASGTNAPMIKLMYPFYDFTTSTDVRRLSWLSRETNTLINVYPNGDVLHTGIKVTVNPYRFRDLKGLLTFLNHEIPLYTGQAAQLFTLTGTKITDLSMLENNGRYVVAAAMDSFIKAQYNSDRYHKSMILLAPPPPPPPSKMAEDLQSPKHMISQTHQIDLSLKRKQSPSTSPSPADFHSPMAQGKHHSRPPSQLKEKFQT
ncbi:Doublecortin domain-containing protein 2C [Coelomomyces lativittatus]|nr:Doublecortin domain-containing protein 2C [Coelomomyces lativittatus]